ncbi:MAG: hypothetical protein WDN01_11815 [Rhizomicrobium sp.]
MAPRYRVSPRLDLGLLLGPFGGISVMPSLPASSTWSSASWNSFNSSPSFQGRGN